MALSAGTRLGTFEILDPIGSGGMGEVYRARDTRLPREVAIKVSAEQFSDRFAREAQVIASLNHPNITTLYDVGPDYLVMELVEGPTLADRIRQGPLPLDEASGIGRQIADALEYAHERGVVHRDLKPGNVKIRPDGVVKVLDFGLAKAGLAAGASHSDDSPTINTPRTEAGIVLGTPAYMAPEQARGREVDARADIWAFGCVFYAMLTGSPPLRGDTSQETIASILRDEPDLSRVHPQARRLLRRCLEKNPQKRLRHIGDVMSLVDEPASGPLASAVASAPAPDASTGSRTRWLWPAVAGVVLVAAAAAIGVWAPWRSQTAPAQAVRFEVGETEQMKFFYGGAMAVSPDGRWMVFPASGADGVARYWVRSLETVEARALPGTETAYVPAAWSADSRQVIFTVLNSNTLFRVDLQGAPPLALTETAGSLNGGSANKDGAFLYGLSTRSPILRVALAGGTAAPVTLLAQADTADRFPQFLPDGRRFLYLKLSNDADRTGVYVGSLDAKPEEQSTTRLLATNRQAYYAQAQGSGPGHLVFLRDTTLMAQPFDPVGLTLGGEAVPIAEGVDSFPEVSYGLFGISESGALVYRGGAGATLGLTWFDQNGSAPEPVGKPEQAVYAQPAVSPDGTRIVAARGTIGAADIWIVDTARGTTTRLTFDPADDSNPVWSPDGLNIVFASRRTGEPRLYVKPADGSAEERLLADQPGTPTSWSSDGRFILFTTISPETRQDIWALPDPGRPSGEAKPFPVVATPFLEGRAQLSPDGRWIAYTSNESSVSDVYVRPFAPGGASGSQGAKWVVSNGLGTMPRWRADGKALFYVTGTRFDFMAVDIDTSNEFQAGTARRLFTAPPPLLPTGWSMVPDGSRFLFVTTTDGAKTTPFTVVLNWAAMLKR